jgi:hypothetical protein
MKTLACQHLSRSASQLRAERLKNAKKRLFGGFYPLVTSALLLFGACVPVKVPLQLAYTPGPSAIITEREYDAGLFKAQYPAGWRVITSAATSPPSVIFVSPDDDALIVLGTDIGEAPKPNVEGEIKSETRHLTIDNDLSLTAVLNASAEKWESFSTVFERVIESIH